MKLYMQIPVSYETETLTIKSLGLTGTAWPVEEAYMKAIKDVPELYGPLSLGKIKQENDKYFLVVPKNEKIYSKILEIEPFPEEAEKKRKKQNHLSDVSPEDVVKYGY